MPQPPSRFQFVVTMPGGSQAHFSEVSGLQDQNATRPGEPAAPAQKKLPGLRKFSNITLKRGVVSGMNDLQKWHDQASASSPQRDHVLITLLDEKGKAARTWRVKKAWPVKLIRPNLKAGGNDVAIEELTLGHEGVTTDPDHD